MLKTLNRILQSAPRPTLISISVLLVGAVATLDHATGFELSFSVFCLIPIALTAWYVGSRTGQVMSVLSAFAWLAVDMTAAHAYSSPLIPYWNATVRLGFFVRPRPTPSVPGKTG